LTIRKDEVTRITESQYGIFVNTPKRSKRLVIWPTIEGYEEVKKHLATWQTIRESAPFSMNRLPRHTAALIIILAMIALFVTDSVLIVLPAAVVLLGVFTYAFIELPRQSKVLRLERLLFGLLFLIWSVITIWRMLIVLG
jgi:4-amino-4-deoxy-L-arabinose transferase-like glycosyltransferase